MLYFVGLGLGDEKDITVKGLEIVKKCDKIYLENYTSVLYDSSKLVCLPLLPLIHDLELTYQKVRILWKRCDSSRSRYGRKSR